MAASKDCCSRDRESPLEAGVFYVIAPGNQHSSRNTGQHIASLLGLLIDVEQIRHAKRPLGDLTMSIEEITRRLGFSNPSCLRQAFCEHTHKTPSAFRQSIGMLKQSP